MATLEISDLTTSYGKTVAVDGLDLHVEDGEFFVILGPSGAGKTTTLKSVAGLVETSKGSVSIAGTDMTQVEPYLRNVAMAFESYALYPQRTVEQNLASPLKSGRTGKYTAAEREERIDQVTTTLGINHLLKRFPRELSNGQRQRVALGRVLVRPADVYLLDEPLSHLDAKLRATMRAELKQLGAMSNTTTLYVTHDYQEALALGDRIAVLRHGRLVQVGTPQQIWDEPVDTFVAHAVGQPEMNLIEARVADGRIRALDGSIDLSVGADVTLPDRVLLGMRPRDLRWHGREAAHDDGSDSQTGTQTATMRVQGKVVLAERLGRSIEISVDVAGTPVIAVTDDWTAGEGDEVDLDIGLEHVHVFSAGDADDDEAMDTKEVAARGESDLGRVGAGYGRRLGSAEAFVHQLVAATGERA